MDFSRSVYVDKYPIYQGDSNAVTFYFCVNTEYEEIDFSELTPYLKLRYADDTTDIVSVEWIVNEYDVEVYWTVNKNQTQISGEVEGQIVFESEDGNVCYNSKPFKFTIEESITTDLLGAGGRTQIDKFKDEIDKLKEEIDESLNKVQEYVEQDFVTSVNGEKGDIEISPSSLGVPTKAELSNEVDKFKNGVYTTYQAENANYAKCDENGNNIENTYAKNDYVEWTLIHSQTYHNQSGITVDLGGKYRRIFVLYYVEADESETPINISPRLQVGINDGYHNAGFGDLGDITIYENQMLLSYELEMICNICKVSCVVADESNSLTSHLKSSTFSNIGVGVGKSYIEQIRLLIYDKNGSFVSPYRAGISIYGIKK